MVFGIIVSLVSTVVSAVSSIGPAVSNFCATVLPRIIPVLEQVGQVLKVIANALLTALDIFKPGEDVEAMGDRALQAAEQGIKPDQFDSFDEYLAEIRNFRLDPEKSSSLSGAEKLAAGLAIGATGMEKKFDVPVGSLGPIFLMAASNPEYFTAERLASMVQTGGSVLDILRYFEGKLGPADANNTRDILMGLERQRSPGKTDDAIYSELSLAEDAFSKLDKQS
jgi:hypothetical protein